MAIGSGFVIPILFGLWGFGWGVVGSVIVALICFEKYQKLNT